MARAWQELERDYVSSLLHGLPFLNNVSDAERHAFLECATLEHRHYTKGQTLLKEGSESSSLFILKSGAVEVTRRKRDELARLSHVLLRLSRGRKSRGSRALSAGEVSTGAVDESSLPSPSLPRHTQSFSGSVEAAAADRRSEEDSVRIPGRELRAAALPTGVRTVRGTAPAKDAMAEGLSAVVAVAAEGRSSPLQPPREGVSESRFGRWASRTAAKMAHHGRFSGGGMQSERSEPSRSSPQQRDASPAAKRLSGRSVAGEGSVRGSSPISLRDGSPPSLREDMAEPLPPSRVGTFGPGEYFGEAALLEPGRREMATVKALGDVEVMVLRADLFQEVFGASLLETMKRETARRARLAASVGLATNIQPEDLKYGPLLGEGSYGRVRLVTAPDGQSFALKSIRKSRIRDPKHVEHLLSERKVLACIDHPFLPYLVATWQTERELLVLQELILGGELFTRMAKVGRIDATAARFYGSCIVAALTYLHDLNIVYRDLKQENLLLDEHGYLKVIDFGFAKILDRRGDRTFTFCGTPDYIAPEIIANTGHGKAADWWALGILLFELLAGKSPFAVGDDPMDTYANICENPVSFPWFFHVMMDGSARNVISALLHKDPDARLGSLAAGGLHSGGRQVRRHPFFQPIDFVALERREIPAPFVPTITSATDTSNFDFEEDSDDDEDDEDSDEDVDEPSIVRLGTDRGGDQTSLETREQQLNQALAAWDTIKPLQELSSVSMGGDSRRWDA